MSENEKASAGPVLTDDERLNAVAATALSIQAAGGDHEEFLKILREHKALRAEVERLRLGNVDRARMPIETRRLIDIANEQRARADTAEARVAALEALLRRIEEWDHMDAAADGPYWRKEIRAALAREGKP